MNVTEKLASWIVSARYEDVPPNAYEQAKKSILDFIGVSIFGSTTPLGRIMIDYIREHGGSAQARILGTNIKTTSADAAFINGILGHSEDYDDLGGVGGHPATVLTPTVLALGEELALSGKEMLLAWVVGYEVGTRLSVNLQPDKDWHPTAIFGVMGAAAAASKLLKLDVLKTRMAIGIAGSEAAGLRRNFGTMTKPFHAGSATRNGIVAAKLASRNYTSDPDIIESPQGYAACFGSVKCNLPAITKSIGQFYYLSEQGTRIKPWPCCGGNHRTLTGILDAVQKYKLNPDDIEHIKHIGTGIPNTGALFRSEVRNGLEGKFCLEYNIAASIIDRKVDLTTFTDERAARGDLQKFMKKVHRSAHNPIQKAAHLIMRKFMEIAHYSHDPEKTIHDMHAVMYDPDANIIIKMKNGTKHDIKLGSAIHLTGDAAIAKFYTTAGIIFDDKTLNKTVKIVKNLESLNSATELMDKITMK